VAGGGLDKLAREAVEDQPTLIEHSQTLAGLADVFNHVGGKDDDAILRQPGQEGEVG